MYDELVKRLRELHPEEFGNAWDFAFACQQAMHEAADAIEELIGFVQEAERDRDEYRERLDKANDTIEELVCKEKFHAFLWNTIQPNEMEAYLSIYNAGNEKEES